MPNRVTVVLAVASAVVWASPTSAGPPPVVLDTDMGNDIDDVFAVGLLHALHGRGECRIAAVTVSKDHPAAGPFCDVLNTFYGRGDIPIGVMPVGKPGGDGPYLAEVMRPRPDGTPAWPHRLRRAADAPPAVRVLRRALAAEADGSVILIAIGPLTNVAALLDSPSDADGPLTGRQLVAAKVRRAVVMAGDFSREKAEFNVFSDRPAAARVFADWPGELVACPFEMGQAYHYPEWSLEKDYRAPAPHPLLAANRATFGGKTNGFMAWDLVAVLHAIRPDRGYFGVSKSGTIRLDGAGVTRHEGREGGRHSYLVPRDNRERVQEAYTALASEPPAAGGRR